MCATCQHMAFGQLCGSPCLSLFCATGPGLTYFMSTCQRLLRLAQVHSIAPVCLPLASLTQGSFYLEGHLYRVYCCKFTVPPQSPASPPPARTEVGSSCEGDHPPPCDSVSYHASVPKPAVQEVTRQNSCYSIYIIGRSCQRPNAASRA